MIVAFLANKNNLNQTLNLTPSWFFYCHTLKDVQCNLNFNYHFVMCLTFLINFVNQKLLIEVDQKQLLLKELILLQIMPTMINGL